MTDAIVCCATYICPQVDLQPTMCPMCSWIARPASVADSDKLVMVLGRRLVQMLGRTVDAYIMFHVTLCERTELQ